MKKVLIIVPAYNEAKNLKKVVDDINSISLKSKYKIDYVIINDGSKDNTKEFCEEMNYNVINLIENLGIGGAVQTGYKYANCNDYDIAIQFDGDGQHDAEYIKNLIKETENGNDLVIGSRFIENLSEFKSTKSRQIGIKIISFLIKIMTGKKIYDPTSGFRAVNRKIINEFSFDYPQEYPEPETNSIIALKGYKIKEIPVNMRKRINGKSSIYLHKNIYYMVSVCLAIILNKLKGSKIK